MTKRTGQLRQERVPVSMKIASLPSLQQPHPTVVEDVIAKYLARQVDLTGIYFRKELPGMDSSSKSLPLLQRVWVFQERHLSRRVIHFGPQEASWECKPKVRTESKAEHNSSNHTDVNSWSDVLDPSIRSW